MMRIRRLKSIVALSVFALVSSCVDQINFALDREDEKLIVYGQLNNLQEEKYLYLSKTTSADRQPLPSGQFLVLNDLPRPVTNAQVLLLLEGNPVASFNMTKPGEYQLSREVEILETGNYSVEILVDGKVIRSSPASMPSSVGTDELSYEFSRGELNGSPEVSQISVYSDVNLPNTADPYYLKWEVEEAYFWQLTFFPNPFNMGPPPCYVFGIPDPERIPLFDGENISGGSRGGNQLLMKRQVDQSFLSRHYFNVKQVSISKEAFDYWRNVRELVNNTGSVFDTPPAPVQGNLENVNDPEEVVLGFFEVARVSLSRIYTTLADVPFVLEDACEYLPSRPFNEYDPTCLSCGAFDDSTNDTPEWWFDQ